MGVGALKRNESWLGDFYCPKKHFMRFLVGFISALNSLGSELLTSSCVIDLQPPFFWEGVSNCPLAFFALCRLVVRPCNKLNCQTNGPNLLWCLLYWCSLWNEHMLLINKSSFLWAGSWPRVLSHIQPNLSLVFMFSVAWTEVTSFAPLYYKKPLKCVTNMQIFLKNSPLPRAFARLFFSKAKW